MGLELLATLTDSDGRPHLAAVDAEQLEVQTAIHLIAVPY